MDVVDPYRPEGLLLQTEDSGRTWFVDEPCLPAFMAAKEMQVGDVVYLTKLDGSGDEEIVPLQVIEIGGGGPMLGVVFAKLRFRHELN